MPKGHTIGRIAEIVGGKVRGDADVFIEGVASLSSAAPSTITWITNPKYAGEVASCKAGAILAPADHGPTPMPAILCDRLSAAVGKTINLFAPELPGPCPGVHPTAVVDSRANLAENVAVGPFVVIEADASIGAETVLHSGVHVGTRATIGAGCRLWDNVVLRERCSLGDRVVVHPNSVIGADGYGFFLEDGRHHKIAHAGTVTVEDDVEIGACCCIDRAKLGTTRIGTGTKIDNLVQIGHNADVGADCLLVAHVSLAGSSVLEEQVVLAGYAGVAEHCVVGKRATCLGYSCVAHDIEPGAIVSGVPARDNKRRLRAMAAAERVPELRKRISDLEQRMQRLERAADNS